MNLEALKEQPVSILTQIACMEQMGNITVGNVKNPSLGSGNLVLILALSCTF